MSDAGQQLAVQVACVHPFLEKSTLPKRLVSYERITFRLKISFLAYRNVLFFHLYFFFFKFSILVSIFKNKKGNNKIKKEY